MPSDSREAGAAHDPDVSIPSWLNPAAPAAYEPRVDREGFLRKNILGLAGMLERVRVGSRGVGTCASPLDRALARVAPPIRLLGLIVLVACTSAATNMMYAYVMLAIVLVMLAARPAAEIAAVVKPAGTIALVTAIVMLPAVFVGQPSSAVRMGVKTFVTMSLVLGLSQHVAWTRIVSALRWLHVPSQVVFVLDMALKDIELLGRAALELSDALALRSVGVARDATAGAAGVMGMTFLRAHDLADRIGEAMWLRGFDGTYVTPRERVASPATFAYVVLVAAMVVLFFVLEGAM